jgi:hypothetical protein
MVTVPGPAVKLLSRDPAVSRPRLPGSQSLSRDCLLTLIALAVQFGLGMVLNLFVQVPASVAHESFIAEVRGAPLGLTLHAVLGTALICAAVILVAGAVRTRDRLMITLAACGLAAVLGAFASGELFVRDGQNVASLTMALGTGVALVCYASALARAKALPA